MKCSDIKKLLSGYLDGDLGEMEKLLVSEHLGICANCSNELDLLKETVSLLKTREPVEPPPDFVVQVRKKIEPRRWWKEAVKIIFLPWHIKIPAEAIATIVIVCILYYIYQQPQQPSPVKPVEPEHIEEGVKEKELKEEAKVPVRELTRGAATQAPPPEKSMAEEDLDYIKTPSIERPAEKQGELVSRRRFEYEKEIEVRPTAMGERGIEGFEYKYDVADSYRITGGVEQAVPSLSEEADEIIPEQIELLLTLKKPKKDLLRIRKYISILNAKEIAESYDEAIREKNIIIQIKGKNYLKLAEKLIQMDAIEPQEVKEFSGEDIRVRLRIR